ncbi:phosphoesterase [Runella slithyformis DSM 19594]|uniref:Phosphoesterase n=2 Tax=Runella TaxID=105 RepID=A0A7U3ZNJ7_RUNSL|nr:phosphoesterase [Runella slithyformis DSM 19594]
MRFSFAFIPFLFISAFLFSQNRMVKTLQVPGRNEFCKIDTTGGYSVLPSGRRVTPVGTTLRITNDPFGLAVSPDGKRAVALHSGALSLIDATNPREALRIPDYAKTFTDPFKGATFLGAAFAPDSKIVYLSGGDKGNVIIFDTDKKEKIGEISLNQPVGNHLFEESFTSDLVLNAAKNELLVLDRAHFRMIRVDLATKQITASIPVGRQPFGLSLSPDKKYAFVANVGLYEYPLVPGVTPKNKDTMMLKFPPYGTFTKESIEGVEAEGRKIPGLGSPLVPEAMSVWMIDLMTNKVSGKFKTGNQIGEMIEEAEIVGGASPNSVAVGKRFAYVSNATNDNISVIDCQTRKITGHIALKVHPSINKYRGLMPFGMALTQDEKTLYVALLGFNAVAVVDLITRKVKGLIPTGWGPTKVKLSPDEKNLYVVSARGLGAGQNGGRGFIKPARGTYIGDIQLGTFQKVPLPSATELQKWTQQAIDNTFETVSLTDDGKNPLPPLPGARTSPIKYIVYVTKENRTYDEVLGQLSKGDTSLARYGTNVTVFSKKDTLRHVDVMPNHQRIAKQFAYSDNFYCDSDASIHGHHWMIGVIPNEWVEANSNHSSTFNAFSKAPGRRFPKATGAIDPEDYNETGGLWEALERKKLPFYSFGEGNEFAGVSEEWDHLEFGARQPVVFPLAKSVFDHTSRNYAGFDMNIPDWLRMDQFEKEFTEKWLTPKKGTKVDLPRVIALQLPNDHGAGVRPEAGYPYPHSFMADNDISLGRMLQFLSHTPYWKNMLVVITEDDPQGGVDHIDAHRSVLMLAGPYVKRGHVSHTHANFGSILKVIYNTLGVPYVNQYDATASLLQDFFTDKPDFTPYQMVIPDKRIFEVDKAMEIYKKTFDWKTAKPGPKMDDPDEQRREHYRQQNEN